MSLSKQTPLAESGISKDQLYLLNALWIENVEEALAMYFAIGEPLEFTAAHGLKELVFSPTATQDISASKLEEIKCARQGGLLGCLVDDQVLDDFMKTGQLHSPWSTPSGAFDADLPTSVRLFENMPPVKDQGNRGTCVAFASNALREFLLANTTVLSEQFLYWACKELDGHPGSGTYVRCAMTAFARYGVCEEAQWPYNPHKTGDEGQGPPPDNARKNALQYRLASTRTVEPHLVMHYKQVLAGENGRIGMPVIFGSLVFNSWYMSSETHRTGKITLPLPGESPQGGHAWCAVGYVDNEDVPGGGYFIVRNSWGREWAKDSPEASGHALIPYAYIERYGLEAFTGPETMNDRHLKEAESEWHEYVRIIDEDERDIEGKLLKGGTQVLFHPFQPEVIREDNPSNRQDFLCNDRTWTLEARHQVWFPPLSKATENLTVETERFRGAKRVFTGAIGENIANSKGKPIPEVKTLPFWFALLSWEPKIKNVQEVADLTEDLVACMLDKSGAPGELDWPDDWRQWVMGMNAMKVYALSGMTATVHVISALPVQVAFQAPGEPGILSPTQESVDLVFDLYSQWAQTNNEHASFKFFTIASAFNWPEQTKGHAGGDYWLVLSAHDENFNWQTSAPYRFADRPGLRNFMDRMYPETGDQRISKIKRHVDEFLEYGYEGYVNVDKIAGITGYRRTVIQEVFFTLQESGHYRAYKTADSGLSIGKNTCKIGTTVKRDTYNHYWLARIAFLGPALSVGAWSIRDIVLGRPFEIWLVGAVLPLAYGGEWLKTRFGKWREGKE